MKICALAMTLLISLVIPRPTISGNSTTYKPEPILIATVVERQFSYLEDPKMWEIQNLFNEYVRMVMEKMDEEFLHLEMNSHLYFHRDDTKTFEQAIFEMMRRTRFGTIVQLMLVPVATGVENSTYLDVECLKVIYQPAADGGSYARIDFGYKKRYRIWSKGLHGGATIQEIAYDFIENLHKSVFPK